MQNHNYKRKQHRKMADLEEELCKDINLPGIYDGTFLYFSFGSYMSSARLRQFCPNASFVSIGQVSGRSVRFCGWSESWKGAGSTMVEGGEGVWGVIWKLDTKQLRALDRQEAPLLERVEVSVRLGSGEKLQCQAYTMCKEEKDELPSPAYLKTIVTGAREHGLPEEYIRNTFLCVQNNGYRE